MTADHFSKLVRMYNVAPINTFYNPKLTIERGKAEIEIAVQPSFFHTGGAVHGSVYFKALDDAAFFAVNSIVEDVFVLTVNFNIYLLQPVTKGILIARGAVVHELKNSFIAEAILYDQDGNQISRGNGSFVKSKVPLDEKLGYK